MIFFKNNCILVPLAIDLLYITAIKTGVLNMTQDTKKIIYSMVNVNKFHGQKQVLKDISLSYFYGAKIGVLGLNGSGKS